MQDGKNLILAIFLCLVVIVGWSYLAEYMGWVQKPDPAVVAQQQAQQQSRQQEGQEAVAPQEAAAQAPLPAFVPAAGRDMTVRTPLYEAVIHTGGGILRSFRLMEFRSGLEAEAPLVDMVTPQAAAVAPLGLVINGQPSWSTGQWTAEGAPDNLAVAQGQEGALRLAGEVDGLRVTRELTFSAGTYLIREKIRIANTSSQARSMRIGYTVAADGSNASGGNYDAMRVAWDNDGSLEDESSPKTLETTGVQASGKIHWGGAMSTYFLAAVLPGDPAGVTVKGRMRQNVYRAALEEPEVLLVPGQEREVTVAYWIGPKTRDGLEAVSPELARSIDLGMFQIIAKGLLWLLKFFYGYVHNWGVAIILLTIVIKVLFWPLTAKSYASMEQMKKLQPHMLAIREKHKDNKELMNKEIMALYKTYGVNPASGCVPILIQMPVFFGLYQALLTAIELRHAHFVSQLPGTDLLWLADLSAKDPYYITPIIMGVTMFVQQKMSPPATDPMQQKIMMFLPLIFTVLFLGFPSGLVLYWLVNNILSIVQQRIMIRKAASPAVGKQ
ncbi:MULTISPECIES: membrane protein insertase YidC [unclassified Desulfovibrio]|uniref:membrane protein insertase YidC n=1 Tax=unclassified Desulfovibrio TaxID=2593640 RepID=UPI000F5F7E23|nr:MULTISPECIES: membrane protein insertase YidC [unclassified Desulfovibrio]RRD71773.1 membrane protein insertase YidC [Desulfovibrio sp. OH1209_COT-279]RRD87986.1 membrane protein insertase YidC [Desulfovibrio sp. OH1186_COT-070]